MIEETKKLFNAPWYVDIHAVDGIDGETYMFDGVYNDKCELVCGNVQKHVTSNRITHLPELYEALMEAKNEIYIMLNEWALGKSAVEYLESYQKRKGRKNHEFFNEIQELLNKVQEGK